MAAGSDMGEIQMEPTTKRVNISRLPPDRKKAAWAWVQRNRPEQADLIQSAQFQELLTTFNGEVIIEMEINNEKY